MSCAPTRTRSTFQLEQCPWCGTEIVPSRLTDDDRGLRRARDARRLRAVLPRATRAPFHDELPVHVVDEDLYAFRPTMLLGTVDKFAQLAWNADGLSVLRQLRRHRRPRRMIIQDELHLLSGPLGTTVGVYEAAIDALCSLEGTAPKIVASTATIRRSDEQVRGLFGGRDVRLFPPSGVDADDSFFAREDTASPGACTSV